MAVINGSGNWKGSDGPISAYRATRAGYQAKSMSTEEKRWWQRIIPAVKSGTCCVCRWLRELRPVKWLAGDDRPVESGETNALEALAGVAVFFFGQILLATFLERGKGARYDHIAFYAALGIVAIGLIVAINRAYKLSGDQRQVFAYDRGTRSACNWLLAWCVATFVLFVVLGLNGCWLGQSLPPVRPSALELADMGTGIKGLRFQVPLRERQFEGGVPDTLRLCVSLDAESRETWQVAEVKMREYSNGQWIEGAATAVKDNSTTPTEVTIDGLEDSQNYRAVVYLEQFGNGVDDDTEKLSLPETDAQKKADIRKKYRGEAQEAMEKMNSRGAVDVFLKP